MITNITNTNTVTKLSGEGIGRLQGQEEREQSLSSGNYLRKSELFVDICSIVRLLAHTSMASECIIESAVVNP